MGVSSGLFGRIKFFDDSDVECDCGCIVKPENDYEVHKFEVVDKCGNTRFIYYTSCQNETGCESNIFWKVLNENKSVKYCGYTTNHIKSAREEEGEYQDYLMDLNEDY